MVRKTAFIVAALLMGMVCSAVHGAQQPMEVLRGPVDQIVSVLSDPQYEGNSRQLGREKLWNTIQGLFDFTEMAKRTLARNWKIFTPEERKEFSLVFGEFLGNTYLNKIQKNYQDEKVIYVKQEMVSDDKAVVQTKVVREGVETPVDYSMIVGKDGWKVYDVKIEGVSLVKNYRTQFEKLLMSKSPRELIRRLKEKVEKQKTGEDVPEEATLESPRACHFS